MCWLWGFPSHTTSAIACSREPTHSHQPELMIQLLRVLLHLSRPSSAGHQWPPAAFDTDFYWCVPTGPRHGSLSFTFSCGSSLSTEPALDLLEVNTLDRKRSEFFSGVHLAPSASSWSRVRHCSNVGRHFSDPVENLLVCLCCILQPKRKSTDQTKKLGVCFWFVEQALTCPNICCSCSVAESRRSWGVNDTAWCSICVQTHWSRPATTAGSSHQLFEIEDVKGMAIPLPPFLPIFITASSSSGRGLAWRVSLLLFLGTGRSFRRFCVDPCNRHRIHFHGAEGLTTAYSGTYASSYRDLQDRKINFTKTVTRVTFDLPECKEPLKNKKRNASKNGKQKHMKKSKKT